MPVSLGHPPAKRCKQCEDSGQNRVESGPHSWSIQLDQDLLDTIIAIYPEWFKEYSQKRGTMLEGSGGESNAPQSLPSAGSPGSLVAEVDESPLQKTMDKNKESLKVKLMMRRPINQLVAQGIMPSLKTPPAFHEQRQKLERAKMGDLLKAKIQQRPDREELVRQHILEADVSHVDPSLAERQRMLKKARLADSLNDQLSHRPGPLELIKKNILHTEEPIERAVKEGVIPFKATSEGQLRKPQHPDHYITFEDDSQSSEGGGSPPNASSSSSSSFPGSSVPSLESEGNKTKESRPRDVLETAAASAGIVNVAVTIPTNAVVVTSPILQQIPNDKNQTLQTFAELCSSVVSPLSLGSSTSSLSPLSSIASPPAPLTPRPASLSSPAPGKADKNRKKSKTKTQPKARTIKFHEYKGPPNAQKNNSVSASSTETSYELLLQQQQLFLQWQLEWQHKYPQIILPAAKKPTSENINNLQSTMSNLTNGTGSGGTTFLVTHSPRSSTPVVQSSAPQTKSPSSPAQPTESQASNQSSTSASPSSSVSTSTFKILTKLEDMKVSDLKMELKKRNLPVSGPKPQLIERLKPFTQTGNSEQHQSEATNRNASNSNGESPGSVWSEMEITTSPVKRGGEDEEAEEEEKESFSPGAKTMSSLPPSPAPSAMDTSEPSPPSSPTNGELIIQQQKKIEELQRELQKSQQQLQQIREGKDSSKMATAMTSSIPVKALLQNGIIHIDPKSQQKLILQQHLQNKIQQQQLQVQLQQQQKGQMNESLNAKANLAAFINQQQAQQQAQQQHNSILQTTSSNASREANNGGNNSNNNSGSVGNTNNNFSNNSNNIGINGNSNSGSNNNNNNNNADNNNNAERNTEKSKNSNSNNNNNNNNNNNVNSSNNNNNIKNKALERRSIVLGQQQAAIVLNHLNLVKQKNGIFGHQRTSSLPTFLGALVQNAINTEDKHLGKASMGKVKNQNAQQKRAGSEEQQTFMVTSKPPPPEYEEATKSLKKDAEESKSVKSQIVDDVLEILIKNGELPPSAANDPATPTANCRSGPFDQESLVFSRRATPPPPPPPPPLPQPGFSVTLPTSITLTSQPQSPPRFNLSNGNFSSSGPFTLTTQSLNPPTYTLTQAYLAASSEGEPGNQASDATPASNITFSITNANFTDNSSKNTFSSGLNYLDQTEYMSTETSDFPLNNSNDQNFHSNSLDYILSSSELSSSNNTMLPSEYGNGDINLRELGLDLETLDTMDFSQFDCKMDVNESELETGGGTTSSTPTPTPSSASIANSAPKLSPSPTSIKTDQLINNNPDLVKPELMEPMDMGDNWLDSLMSSSENSSGNGLNSYSAPGYEFLQCGDSSYDSLLGSGQDPFELFDIHDNDFKLPSSSLSWDKVDFAT